MAANPLAGSVPAEETPARIAAWLAEHAVGQSQDLHLLTMAVGVLISLLTHKTELIVRGVYGAGKTQCIALLAAFFALRGHQVYYAARENTTIVAMATFVHQLLPREPDDEWPDAIRLVSQPQARTSEGTPLDARDTDKNQQVWHAKLVLATTGLHLAQFRHKHRPLAKAVDYADIFIYDEAQQEAALSDLAILGALPRKCLVLRLGDPKQTSGGTGSSDLARQVRHISDQLALGIRAARKPYLPQMLPMLLQSLLLDDLPPEMATPLPERTHDKGVSTVGATGALPGGRKPAATVPLSADAARAPLACALLHVVGDVPPRWHTAGDLDACAGERAPHNWCVMLPVSRRVQPGVYTMMALSRYRDALLQNSSPERPLVYQPLIPQLLTASYHCDVRYAKLDDLLKGGLPPPSAVNSRHVQALHADLRAETLSHAAGLTSHSTILMYGKSGFLRVAGWDRHSCAPLRESLHVPLIGASLVGAAYSRLLRAQSRTGCRLRFLGWPAACMGLLPGASGSWVGLSSHA